MAKFTIAPHMRLHEWVAEEKGYFTQEGLDYEFREALGSKDAKQHDLDDKGIAKTAREEKLRARNAKAKDAEMMKLYRQHVLKEEPLEGFVPLAGIAPAPAPVRRQPRRERSARGRCSSE